MHTITVKNIPPDIYKRLKRIAEANRRSLNSQILVVLEQSVTSRKLDPAAILAQARKLRERTASHKWTDAELAAAKAHGRE